jgi:hypothetical protein
LYIVVYPFPIFICCHVVLLLKTKKPWVFSPGFANKNLKLILFGTPVISADI